MSNSGVRDAVEQAILLSLGAASLTRERVDGIVEELIRTGRITAEEGWAVAERLVSRTRDEAVPLAGLMAQAAAGLRGVLREAGVPAASDLEELRGQLADLERRITRLERPGGGSPG